MGNPIKDGSGTGVLAKVDSNKRLYSDSVERSHSEEASFTGNSYNINTGVVNLTSANKSAVLYMKNTGEDDLVVSSLFYLIGNSTGGSGDVLITVLRNPTAGTIIDGATDVEINVNRNFGSSNTLSGSYYVGSEAETFTNGTKVIESIFNQSATRAALNVGAIILPKGTSLGIEITPATSNTSLDVEFAVAVHTEEVR